MADYGDKPKDAQTGFLDELVAGIQDAVVSAQRMAEKQHIEMVDTTSRNTTSTTNVNRHERD